VVEDRMRRTLFVRSVLALLFFGGRAVLNGFWAWNHFYEVSRVRKTVPLRPEGCPRPSWETAFPDDPPPPPPKLSDEERKRCDAVEEEIRQTRDRAFDYYSYGLEEEQIAVISTAWAIGIPITLWAVFFTGRWCWTGQFCNIETPTPALSNQLVSAVAARVRTARPMRWILWTAGTGSLFLLNAALVGEDRAIAVVVSALVQAVVLGTLAWVIGKSRRSKSLDQKDSGITPLNPHEK
jgi:hypothetical protein